MEISQTPVQEIVTKEEYKKRALHNYRMCWRPLCKNYAFLRDWAGWKWCIKHWIQNYRYGHGEDKRWFFIKSTKIEFAWFNRVFK